MERRALVGDQHVVGHVDAVAAIGGEGGKAGSKVSVPECGARRAYKCDTFSNGHVIGYLAGAEHKTAMTVRQSTFLPGVPEDLVRTALGKAGGNEINSGKLDNPESSAALAVNAFGWFIERPAELPPFPPLADLDWPATRVEVERQMRFPWSGGRHPWLDAAVDTPMHIIGIESKRFEPFRDVKAVRLSEAYNRDVWGDRMAPFTAMRDALREGAVTFAHLDAAQLIKHAFGLVTEGHRLGKAPVLLYLYAEPERRGSSPIPAKTLERHRSEIASFANAVVGAEVRFAASSWREWLAGWSSDAQFHAEELLNRFSP